MEAHYVGAFIDEKRRSPLHAAISRPNPPNPDPLVYGLSAGPRNLPSAVFYLVGDKQFPAPCEFLAQDDFGRSNFIFEPVA